MTTRLTNQWVLLILATLLSPGFYLTAQSVELGKLDVSDGSPGDSFGKDLVIQGDIAWSELASMATRSSPRERSTSWVLTRRRACGKSSRSWQPRMPPSSTSSAMQWPWIRTWP